MSDISKYNKKIMCWWDTNALGFKIVEVDPFMDNKYNYLVEQFRPFSIGNGFHTNTEGNQVRTVMEPFAPYLEPAVLSNGAIEHPELTIFIEYSHPSTPSIVYRFRKESTDKFQAALEALSKSGLFFKTYQTLEFPSLFVFEIFEKILFGLSEEIEITEEITLH